MAGGVSVVLPCIITCAKGLRFLRHVKHVDTRRAKAYFSKDHRL